VTSFVAPEKNVPARSICPSTSSFAPSVTRRKKFSLIAAFDRQTCGSSRASRFPGL
jgi:hypothetical protein